MKRLLISMALVSLAVAAADVTGTWKGTAETQNGTFERTFVFKVDGSKLTGETTSEFAGKSIIEDGKVDGDNISFSIVANIQGDKVKLNYKGKVSASGNEMKLNGESADGAFSLVYNTKRIS